MLKIAICDDNDTANTALEKMLCTKADTDGSGAYFVQSFTHDKPLETYINRVRGDVDILFLDVDLNGINGIEIAKGIQSKYPNIKIVFITGTPANSQDIFEVVPFGLLLKPIEARRLSDMIDKLRTHPVAAPKGQLVLKMKSGALRILYCNIVYIESEGRIAYIYTKKEVFAVYEKLKNLVAMLPPTFVHTHQSFIVNLEYVQRMETNAFFLQDGTRIIIAKARYAEAKCRFLNFIGKNT